jgi:pSer/pThr/pTyr-binding forkhead associated (FHA) protein
MIPELRIVNGPLAGQVIVLTGKQFLIGREHDCDLRPDSELVSRHHCVIRRDDFTVRIRDLGSRNGTYVNGHRIQGEVVLGHDDTLFIGDLTLQVQMGTPQIARPFGNAASQETVNLDCINTEVFNGTTTVAPKDYPAQLQQEQEQPPESSQPQSAPQKKSDSD